MHARGHQIVHQVVVVRDRVEHPAHAARLVLTRHALKAEVGGALVGHGGARSESDETHSSRSAASVGAAIAVAFFRRRRAESRPSRGSCARSGAGINSRPPPLLAPGARSWGGPNASAAP